jgi:hypothetical protein
LPHFPHFGRSTARAASTRFHVSQNWQRIVRCFVEPASVSATGHLMDCVRRGASGATVRCNTHNPFHAEIEMDRFECTRVGSVGALAQLGERLVCNQEVIGSIPIRSIVRRGHGQPRTAGRCCTTLGSAPCVDGRPAHVLHKRPNAIGRSRADLRLMPTMRLVSMNPEHQKGERVNAPARVPPSVLLRAVSACDWIAADLRDDGDHEAAKEFDRLAAELRAHAHARGLHC